MNDFSKPFRKVSGFTLIELLVVVAVISILAAILFPVFARARESARRSSCMSNLKQIGLGIRMYSQDYDEKLPPCREERDGDAYYWYEVISPYTSHYSKRTQLYRCPSSYVRTGRTQSDFQYGNYTANRNVLLLQTGLPLSAVASPSTIYMIFDGGSDMMSANQAWDPKGDKPNYLPGTGPGTANNIDWPNDGWHNDYIKLKDDFVSGRHFGGMNMLFADGHVKWLKSQVAVEEAKLCGSGRCLQNNINRFTTKSAWNPRVDNS